ncbi:carboxylesterase family protein, partial [Algoriphagus aestuarii]|nr:carboxylesterase family protein [Algoriphagus aestuarii]
GSTHGYEFRFSSDAMGGAMGAAHAVEIPFMFDNLDRGGVGFLVGTIDDEMRDLSTAMADAWVAFAATGSPHADGLPDWPGYDSDGRNTMILDRT